MKKIKLLLAALAAMVGLSVQAQTDITSTYLTNADLSTVDNGWTYYSDAYKYQAWRTGNETLSPAVEFYAGWGVLEHTNFKFSQTVTLPAGDYRIAVNAFYREGNGGDGTNNNKAWIFAGDHKQNVVALTSGALNAWSSAGDDMNKAMAAFHDGSFSNAFDFSLDAETQIDLGFEGCFTTMYSWCILGPVKLYKYSLDDYLVDYDAKYAAAEAISGKMNAIVQEALTAAMVDRSTFSTSSQVTAAIATLNTAITNANNSIAYYSSLKSYMDAVDAKTSLLDSYGTTAYDAAAADAKAAYNDGTATDGTAEKAALDAAFKAGVLATKQPGNGLDMTAYITNPDFDGGNYDGWTRITPLGGNCTIQGGSRMEYWAGNASDRALASFDIYQELENLPAGVYTISADMYNSLNDEGGDYTAFSPTCGVYGSSSNEEVALVTEEGTTLKTYTTGEVLYFRGKLRIGTKNTETPMAARWFLFDNVKLTYARQLTQEEIDANTVPESITLASTANITIFGTTTLEATVLPENATDKSITWTSSNENVATVNANGVVTAKSPGVATITATANGADGVTATCEVTVNDVAEAAAPTFYSSEIVSGEDYYLVNAATGNFLGGANDWGTHASIIEHGVPFTATKINDGVYTLASPIWNSATDHYVTGTYVDNTATNLTITSVGNGKFTISNAEGLMSAQPSNTYVETNGAANSVLAQWYFLSKNDRDKMLAAATNENPVDATYYVKQANPGRNLSASNTKQGVNAWSNYNLEGDNANKIGQLYQKAGDISQTIENIPNGTYTVTVQAFTTGSATFYANEQEVDVLPNSESIGAAATAANRFAAKAFTNTLTVTVTDRTLKIGLKTEDTDKWLVWDDVALYMTGYTANTGISAEIDNEEIEAGNTAQITAATVPATASFNAITYSSSDETIATVDANGLVTGLKIGDATITVTANEMENFSTTVDVTVVAVTPTALEFEDDEITLDKETATATLVLVPTPEDANATVTWTSSNETVATVADGVVTAVSTGTATITATSTIDTEVSATATINVSFPETEIAEYTNDGATRYVHNYGANLIKNGTFEYPNGYYGWKNGASGDLSSSNFEIATDGENKYLKAKNSEGAGSANSIKTAWPIEDGKTYVFGYKAKASTTVGDKSKYIVVSTTNTIGTETNKVSNDNTPVTTSWTEVSYKFTNSANHAYVQLCARWLANSISFDDVYLVEVVDDDVVVGNVDYATAAIPTANIGTNAFQYSQDAIDAANALVQGTATVDDVVAAYTAVTTLNAPDAEKLYNIVVAEAGNAKIGNALVIVPGTTGANNPTGYGLNVNLAPNTNLNQAVTFTKVSGNNYNISFETAAGTTYLTTGSLNGSAAGWNKQQIQATTDAEKKCAFTIVASDEDNVFYIYNPEYKEYVDYQEGGSLYTDTNIDHKAFSLAETTKPSITINTTTAGWGTVMLPFAVAALPDGVKAYSVSELKADQKELNLVEVNALEANKPYIIEGAWNETVDGDAQGTALTYTDGLLTGVYKTTEAPIDSYVLQMPDLEDKNSVGFYRVAEGTIDVPANRAYLTTAAGVKAFILNGGDTDAIKSVFDGIAAGKIFDLSGRKVAKMQKGNTYIVNGKKVNVK